MFRQNVPHPPLLYETFPCVQPVFIKTFPCVQAERSPPTPTLWKIPMCSALLYKNISLCSCNTFPPTSTLWNNSLCLALLYKNISLCSGRTFPTHPYFKDDNGLGQTALCNVLKAYSMFDVEVTYCQGMNFVAGLLLTYVSAILWIIKAD